MQEERKEALVFSLDNYRKKKKTRESLTRGRAPLYSTHLNSSGQDGCDDSDFSARIDRIKESIDAINALVSDCSHEDQVCEKLRLNK